MGLPAALLMALLPASVLTPPAYETVRPTWSGCGRVGREAVTEVAVDSAL